MSSLLDTVTWCHHRKSFRPTVYFARDSGLTTSAQATCTYSANSHRLPIWFIFIDGLYSWARTIFFQAHIHLASIQGDLRRPCAQSFSLLHSRLDTTFDAHPLSAMAVVHSVPKIVLEVFREKIFFSIFFLKNIENTITTKKTYLTHLFGFNMLNKLQTHKLLQYKYIYRKMFRKK